MKSGADWDNTCISLCKLCSAYAGTGRVLSIECAIDRAGRLEEAALASLDQKYPCERMRDDAVDVYPGTTSVGKSVGKVFCGHNSGAQTSRYPFSHVNGKTGHKAGTWQASPS